MAPAGRQIFLAKARKDTPNCHDYVYPAGVHYMHRPQHFARRSVLGMLAASQIGIFSRPASASQAEMLAAAEFTDERSTVHYLNELDRPLLLVNLWAAWCPGCLTEMPTMQALASLLGPDAIDVVLLSHAMNWKADLAYARRAGLPFRQWRLSSRVPDAAVAAVFRVQDDRFGLPQSLVFAGRRRQLVASYIGSRDWIAPEQLRLARGWLDSVG
jgi:thiol-disulfide isomerase/thioredoxin